ncbi:MAG: hypothetical protein EBZ77_12945 [Chitinophagia bacterium]|nr:hypothetical protein [Chitinophagia bacterium]
MIQTDLAFKAFNSSIHIPGAIKERFVTSRGEFYEGAMAQAHDADSLMIDYQLLSAMLDSCLLPQQFHKSKQPTFDPKVTMFKKIAYLPEYNANTDYTSLKGHVAMEVDYNKANGTYTLELFIYQH